MIMPPLIRKIEPGDVIGRCRAIRELGRGGVGTVYLATHQTLQIEVALKVLSPSLSLDNPALAERFIREAQLAARIRHPNVIAVMDAAHDESTGLYFIVMEYVGGGSLAWHLRNGQMPEKKALSIVTGIAHALAIAEENRIVHRDIKPENIMLDLRGTAKLADLGLAKQALDSHLSLTLGGSFMGTPAYMSPEQARDAKIADTRDDIYSLGASFYECLTGEPPFQGETPYNIMSELLTKPSPIPSTLRPDISVSTDLICRKMMAKTRELRYADAHALLADLQIAQTYGDSGLDRLEASSFDQDSSKARQEQLSYGIETSSDGAYAAAEQREVFPTRARIASPLVPPRPVNNDVFGAAALLIVLVLVTTLLFAWAAPNHPLSFLRSELAQVMGVPKPTLAQATKPTEKKQATEAKEKTVAIKAPEPTPHVAKVENPPVHVAPSVPVAPTNPEATPTLPPVAPVATLAELSGDSNAPAANPVGPVAPIPAQVALPDSAFVARDVAEKSLNGDIVAPTGHAELLKVVGKRDEAQATPTTWMFYFFDKKAAGHARIVSVTGGQVGKTGEDVVDFASPYSDRDVLPEDKIEKDSNDALQIAQGLVPGVTVTGSEFSLVQQKNLGPMWKVTLWTKNGEGEDHKLGDVTLRADSGVPNSINLKP
jgi:serine/threonine protein kinase